MGGRAKGALAVRKQTLRRLVVEIREHAGRAGREIYEVGRRLLRIRDQRLFEGDGYATFGVFADEALPFSRRQANRLIRIAGHFNAAIAARYGIEKLDLMLRWMEATPEEERPGDLLASDIRVRGGKGRFASVALHVATATQIREAIALLRESKEGARRVRLPVAVRKRARSLSDALPPAPSGLGRGDRVSLRQGKDGVIGVTFRDIPVTSLEDFIEALREHFS